MEEFIFALDIGTRTVIGLVCKVRGEKIEVLAHHVETHKDRAMKDGQIHDIGQVAMVVKKVKEHLEKKLNISLTKASIAAAGRTLRTIKASAISDLSEVVLLKNEHLQEIELQALLKCKNEINLEYPDEPLYCVGYSVVSRKINGFHIDNLEGQKGGYIEIEIIATFLPNIVVDSLFEVLKRVDIAIESLTLEPIAAIEVAIPPKYRMLNLALVDIGAGTSDIAISKGGTIIGYGMVQKAGDIITEKLAEHYLIDFNTAEKLKIDISSKDKIAFTDILGIKHEIKKEEFNKSIEPAVNSLISDIASQIKELNGKEPSAVFCVGGGSQIDSIRIGIANELNIPLERVAVRGRDALENITFRSKKLKGPEVVTPLGIAAIAKRNTLHNFIKIYVNGKEVTIFNAKKTTIAQGLFSAGYKIEDLLKARKSKGLEYSILGEKIIIPGGKGYPGEIYLNGEKASLDTAITDGDQIKVLIPDAPKEPVITLSEVIKPYSRIININDTNHNLLRGVKVNGQDVSDNYIIKNKDEIEVTYQTYLSDIIKGPLDDYNIYLDGVLTQGDTMILNSRKVSYVKKGETTDGIIKGKENDCITVKANGKLVYVKKVKPLIVDVFDKMNINIAQINGSLKITKNGLESGFADEVRSGDIIEIFWN